MSDLTLVRARARPAPRFLGEVSEGAVEAPADEKDQAVIDAYLGMPHV